MSPRQRAIDLLRRVDAETPDCGDGPRFSVEYLDGPQLVQEIRTGRAVVIGRGLFRLIRQLLEER